MIPRPMVPIALAAIGVLIARAGWGADPVPVAERSPEDLDIQVGDEVVVHEEEGELPAEIEIDGEVYEIPDLSDVPFQIDAEEGDLRISIGDEVAEVMRDTEEWEPSDTPYRISFGHDVYIGPEEFVEGDVWSFGGDVTVVGTVDGDVVVLAADIVVEGEVYGDVVALWGSVELEPDAICGSDVVALNGNIEQNRAHVDGETFTFGLLPGGGGIPELERVVLICAAASLVLFGAFAAILGLIFRPNTDRMLTEMSARPFHSFWIGFALYALGPLVIGLLMITVVGLPLALLGGLLWWAVAQSGVVLGAVRIGHAMLRRGALTRLLPGALVGAFILHLPFVLGAVAYARGGPGFQTLGLLLLTVAMGVTGVLTLMGSGALISTRFGESGAPDAGVSSSPLFEPIGDRSDAT